MWLISVTGTGVLLSEESCEQLVSLICMIGTGVLLSEESCERLVSLICMTGTRVLLLSEESCEQLVSLICMTETCVLLLAEASHAATFGCRQANFVPVTCDPWNRPVPSCRAAFSYHCAGCSGHVCESVKNVESISIWTVSLLSNSCLLITSEF